MSQGDTHQEEEKRTMHGGSQHISDDQAEKLGDGRVLRFECIDRRENRGERRQADAQEDRSESPYRHTRDIRRRYDLRRKADDA